MRAVEKPLNAAAELVSEYPSSQCVKVEVSSPHGLKDNLGRVWTMFGSVGFDPLLFALPYQKKSQMYDRFSINWEV